MAPSAGGRDDVTHPPASHAFAVLVRCRCGVPGRARVPPGRRRRRERRGLGSGRTGVGVGRGRGRKGRVRARRGGPFFLPSRWLPPAGRPGRFHPSTARD